MHCQKPCSMDNTQGAVKYWPEPIMCPVDHQFPDHLTGACVRTDPPSLFYLAGCLFNLSSEHCQSVPRTAVTGTCGQLGWFPLIIIPSSTSTPPSQEPHERERVS